MELKNYTETLVDEAIKDYLNKNEILAKELSKDDIEDIKAFSLNNLPPHYMRTQKGYAFTKLEEINIQSKTSVLKTVIQATEKIIKNRHTKE